MLQPPEQFSQLKALQWTAPLITGALVFASVKLHGLVSGDALLWVTGSVMVLTWVLSMLAVWGSAWSGRHQFVSVGGAFVLVVAPMVTLFLPQLSLGGALSGMRLSGLVLLVFLVVLLLSGWHHARRCAMPSGDAKKVSWPPCQIDLTKHTFSVVVDPQTSRFPAWPAASVGAASVVLYHWLASMTSENEMVVIAAVIALAMGLCLCLLPLGRALGQAWRLRQLEAQRGVRLVSARLPWLTKERQQFAFGRWWARTFD